MRNLAILSLAAIGSGLAAQANTVAGLNGRLTAIDQLTYYGRRGAAYPNGQAGMAMLNEMCNPGSVTIPWQAPMQPNHPKFGFIIARVANDRIEQINEWSYVKHAFLSVNSNGPCGTCQNPGTGQLMGINCADAYGPGNNSDRYYLGPPAELDPWLGTWNPVGSYFDRGDPAVSGAAAMDGIRSLSQSQVNAFDAVKNRVTVNEIDLTTAGATYYYALQLIHQGEALGNRDDNNAHRGFNPSWNGSSWSFANNSAVQQYGTVLTRWPGATVNSGHNGNDDGRFYVASKVTALTANTFHYEYAVHNIDNSRAGGSLRIPIDASATATNFTFGDIDTNSANDWTVARVGNEIVFTAAAGNPLEWNTFYNFGFDADFPPGQSLCHIDEARNGAGAPTVDVQTEVPGGSTIASFTKFGQGCHGSTQIALPPCSQFTPAGGNLANTLSTNEYVYRVATVGNLTVDHFDIWTASTGGNVTVQARIYATSGALPPATTPLATTSLTIGATPGFYRATFNPPVQVTGAFYIGYDNTAQNAYLNDLVGTGANIGYSRPAGGSTWTLQILHPSYVVECITPPQYLQPTLNNTALPNLGGSYGLTLSNALASSVAVLVSGTSNTTFNGAPLPAALPNAPGCNVLVAPEVLTSVLTDPAGAANSSVNVPNTMSLVGSSVYHQWAVLDAAANTLGIVVSDAGRALIGM